MSRLPWRCCDILSLALEQTVLFWPLPSPLFPPPGCVTGFLLQFCPAHPICMFFFSRFFFCRSYKGRGVINPWQNLAPPGLQGFFWLQLGDPAMKVQCRFSRATRLFIPFSPFFFTLPLWLRFSGWKGRPPLTPLLRLKLLPTGASCHGVLVGFLSGRFFFSGLTLCRPHPYVQGSFPHRVWFLPLNAIVQWRLSNFLPSPLLFSGF